MQQFHSYIRASRAEIRLSWSSAPVMPVDAWRTQGGMDQVAVAPPPARVASDLPPQSCCPNLAKLSLPIDTFRSMSIRQRLYPNAAAVTLLKRHCADARYVWNLGLEQRNFWRPGMKSLSVYDQKRDLTEARAAHAWLAEGSSSVQQQALFDLQQAFRNWWINPTHFRHPVWRRAGVHEGFYIRDLRVRRVSRRWAEVHIPKADWVRFRTSRSFSEIRTASSARVTLNRAGMWHVSFTTRPPSFRRPSTGRAIGLDLGTVASVSTSDHVEMRMPKLLTDGESQRLLRLQRRLGRQQKDSIRRARTKLAYAVLREREASRREDWIEKTTTELVRQYDVICLEDLKVSAMTRSAHGSMQHPGHGVRQKASLNRAIRSQAWGKFRVRLQDKARHASASSEITLVNPAYTSQRCSNCGYVSRENRKSQASFSCISCGQMYNADFNAARNILAAGLAVSGRGGTPRAYSVERPSEASTESDWMVA
jgi:putative transposase